jgi:hypothetical protein
VLGLTDVPQRILLVLALAAPLAAACATSAAGGTAGSGPGSEPAALASSETSSGAGADAQTGSPAQVPAVEVRGCDGRIGVDRLRRSAIKRTVDAGLGRWLQTISVDPMLAQGHFKGWIIRSLDSNDSCYAGIDLRSGDVVTRVNGRSIEHPEEALDVWAGLPASRELVVDFLRGGEPRTLRFGIVDQ